MSQIRKDTYNSGASVQDGAIPTKLLLERARQERTSREHTTFEILVPALSDLNTTSQRSQENHTCPLIPPMYSVFQFKIL